MQKFWISDKDYSELIDHLSEEIDDAGTTSKTTAVWASANLIHRLFGKEKSQVIADIAQRISDKRKGIS